MLSHIFLSILFPAKSKKRLIQAHFQNICSMLSFSSLQKLHWELSLIPISGKDAAVDSLQHCQPSCLSSVSWSEIHFRSLIIAVFVCLFEKPNRKSVRLLRMFESQTESQYACYACSKAKPKVSTLATHVRKPNRKSVRLLRMFESQTESQYACYACSKAKPKVSTLATHVRKPNRKSVRLLRTNRIEQTNHRASASCPFDDHSVCLKHAPRLAEGFK